MMCKPIFTSLICFFTFSLFCQGTQLLRQPTISAEYIVFVYADDLWRVAQNGGDAVRLTANEGAETNPHLSPDGEWVAFTGEYDGNTDVYIVPVTGGSPKRLTYHPGVDQVQGWTPSGEVLFRSGRAGHPTQLNQLYRIGSAADFPTAIEVPRAAYGELSPDGRHLAYTPITFWDPEWRNYRGGQAMPVWIVNLESKELTRTPQPTKERHLEPVWVSNTEIYYLSERDYASNIWSYNITNGAERQITSHADFDVKSLDVGDGKVVYEQGSYLHLLDLQSGASKQLEIHVKGDMSFSRPRWEDVPNWALANPELSPNGKRAIFEYRGEIFSVPKTDGDWRNLSNSPGSAERYPVWSPKGDRLAWFSDKSGEYQLVIANQMGIVQEQIDLPGPTFYYRPSWSADGENLAFTDTDYNIWTLNIASKEARKVDADRYAHPNRAMNPIWSPDGKWLAYAKQLESHFKAVFVFNNETGERLQLTDGMADATSPVWDESGDYLYFLASTDYGLNSGWLDMSSYDPGINRSLYGILLSKDTPSPYLPTSDEEEATVEEESEAEETDEEDETIVIDVDQISRRIFPIDVPSRNYVGLVAGPEKTVFYLEAKPNESGLTLHKYDLAQQESDEYATGVQSVVSTFDRKSILYRKGSSWTLAGTGTKPSPGKGALDMGLRIKVDPRAEYKQIFRDGWRFMRDFLYVENVHGAPWDNVWEWYSPWLEHVRHRSDLNYVLDIMSGEVSIGHSYVRGGDLPDIERVGVGLLGADFERENNRYRITKIYNGESWNPNLRGPLATPGIDANEGDYLLAVNGHELTSNQNLFHHFEETVRRQTVLTLNSEPTLEGAREVTVIPIGSERSLRTFDWVEENRRRVDEMSNGQLAYVYVPNTGQGGFTFFNRYYFAQQDRKGVVIDERNNGGGSAADYMIDIMNRQLFGYFNSASYDRRPWTTPMAGIWGPKVMIINERAGSGGDLLPYMFKAANIGPLIGTRTWGGLVGTWDTPPFIDGGRFVAPRGGFYDANGEWAVEGTGVAPDIEVIQAPKEVLAGKDPQLEAAVQEALRLLEAKPFELKPEPAPPVRYRRPGN